MIKRKRKKNGYQKKLQQRLWARGEQIEALRRGNALRESELRNLKRAQDNALRLVALLLKKRGSSLLYTPKELAEANPNAVIGMPMNPKGTLLRVEYATPERLKELIEEQKRCIEEMIEAKRREGGDAKE